jgi:hypothetical protein
MYAGRIIFKRKSEFSQHWDMIRFCGLSEFFNSQTSQCTICPSGAGAYGFQQRTCLNCDYLAERSVSLYQQTASKELCLDGYDRLPYFFGGADDSSED